MSERCGVRKTQLTMGGFECGRGHTGTCAKECRQLLEAGKDENMIVPLEPPGRNTVLPTPGF